VLRALSLCTCCRQYPGAAAGRRRRSSHPAVSAFPEIAVGSACTSTFSGLARRSLALRPAHSRRHLYVTCYTEGFSHFVTSMTAPVASGWSGWPDGACTRWKAPPSHGARKKRSFPRRGERANRPEAVRRVCCPGIRPDLDDHHRALFGVRQWISGRGCEATAFSDNSIDADVLADLTDGDLA
jgi:hypothetical protein